MRLYIPILFLTLVLSWTISFAAPTMDRGPAPIEMSPRSPVEEIPLGSTKDRDLSLRLGLLAGALKETNQAEQLYFYGFRYDFLREPLQTWEFEVTTGGNNFLHLVLAEKFYFPLEDITRPYYKFAVGDLIDSAEGLGSIFNIKKIQGMAAVGLDDLFKWDQRLQGEIAIAYALIGPQLELSLGIAF